MDDSWSSGEFVGPAMLSIDRLVTSWQRSDIDANSMDLMPQNLTSLAFRSRTTMGVAIRMSLNTGILIFCNWSSVSRFHSSEIVVVWSEKIVRVESQTLSCWFSGICWWNLMLLRATRISIGFVFKSVVLNDFQIIWPLTLFHSWIVWLIVHVAECRNNVKFLLKEVSSCRIFGFFGQHKIKMPTEDNKSRSPSTMEMSSWAEVVGIVVVDWCWTFWENSAHRSTFGWDAKFGWPQHKRMTSNLVNFPNNWARTRKNNRTKFRPQVIETIVSQIVVHLSTFEALTEFWSKDSNLAKIASADVA